jgi:predicted dehydrogenase
VTHRHREGRSSKKRPGGRRVTRRRFLKGAAAAAVAAPYVITWPAHAGGVNDEITLGAIGVGGMGNANLGGLLHRTRVIAVCDVDSKKREDTRKRVEDHYSRNRPKGGYKGCDAYADFRDLLARDDIDAVMIATPDHWHAITSIQAAKAGKDIYCEKPMSLTVREARAMVTAVRRYDRVFQTGSQQRSGGEFRLACELVRSGRIGRLETINVSVGGPSGNCNLPAEPVPDHLDWDMWLGPAPWRPYNKGLHPFNWRGYRDYSGGGMTDWGAHHFDIGQWALDMDESGPVEIFPPDGKEHERLTFRYARGVEMYHGDGGKGVIFRGTGGEIEVWRGGLRASPEEVKKEPLGPNEVHLRKSPGHHDDWIECIRSRKRPICDVEVGCRSVTVCHLGNIAYWLKRPLKWDPVKEEIVGDAEANRWLGRPKRAPWRL